MKTVGFRSTGTLCYYGSHPLPHHERVDVRDIIQFVPRALVFIVVVALYSKLYLFLRRPDTIQLSSQIASGELSARKDSAVKMLRPLGKFGRLPSGKSNGPVDPDAPWEQLEFVTVCHERGRTMSPTTSYIHPVSSMLSGILVTSRPVTRPPSPKLAPIPVAEKDTVERKVSSASTIPTESPSMHDFAQQSDSETLALATPEMRYTAPDIAIDIFPHFSHHVLSPVLSEGKGEVDFLNLELEEMEANRSRASGQTLKEFFQEYRSPGGDDATRVELGDTATAGKGGIQTSAATYFNRQASLLMLFFSLAVSKLVPILASTS